MVRPLDVATQGAIRNRDRIVVRDFVLVTKGEDTWGFTTFGEDVSLNILDGVTGEIVNRAYLGDNRPILDIDPIPMKIGIEVNTTNVVLNQLHPGVLDMVRGHDCRGAVMQIHRGHLDPASMLLVAAPRIRRLGLINGAPIETPAAGGRGSITIRMVSSTRELTRTNPARRSDEQQRLRLGDRFRRYGGITSYDYWWGEKGGN
jgi:hypothetical protein